MNNYALLLCLTTVFACSAGQNIQIVELSSDGKHVLVPTTMFINGLTQTLRAGSQPTVPTNMHLNITSSPHMTSTTSSGSTASTQTGTQLGFSDMYASGKKYASNLSGFMWQWAGDHKLLLTVGAAAAVYGTLLYNTYRIQEYLCDDSLWANWNVHTPMIVILQKSHPQLAQELVLEIERRYANPANPIDSASPLTTFMQAVAEEKKTLLYYQKIYKYLTYVPYNTTFGVQEEHCAQIQDRLERLAHYSTVFSGWLADYNAKRAALFRS